MATDGATAKAAKVTKDEGEVRNKTVQIEPDVYEKIENLAAAAERTIAKQTNRILRQAFQNEITGD